MRRFSWCMKVVVSCSCAVGLLAASSCGPTSGRQQPPTVSVAQLGGDIPADAIGIDLVNETAFTIDPFIWMGGFPLGLRTLAPFEGVDGPVAFDVDCFPGDELVIDPGLLQDSGQVLPDNGPVVLLEGVDYSCGDLISTNMQVDANNVYFVTVAVNDFLVAF